jgi:dihydrofolate reductase
MPRLRVASFSISVDGYAAGPDQDIDNPLGVGGTALHAWAFPTNTFQKMFGSDGGTTGVDDDYAARSFDNIGAWIIGRNMFGPIRGPWPDDGWKGWWGDPPPYHTPVFVLTHHPRASISMQGGTTFHFVTDGIHAALRRATEAANGRDIRLGGGAAIIREYPACRTHRRDAYCNRSRGARIGRASFWRYRLHRVGLRVHRALRRPTRRMS